MDKNVKLALSLDIPNLFHGFRTATLPPEPAFLQFITIWHCEFVLRHFLYSNLRLRFGDGWEDCLDRLTDKKGKSYRQQAEFDRKKAKRWEYKVVDITPGSPPDFWFLTLGQLGYVLEHNWDCLKPFFGGTERKKVIDAFKDLLDIRNRWAHFYPVNQQSFEKIFSSVWTIFFKPFKRWIADYWNSDPLPESDPLIRRCKSADMAVPLQWTPIPGVHWGFADPKRPLDRGWSLFITQTRSGNCLWVQPTPVGMSQRLGLKHLVHFAKALENIPVHIAAVFEVGEPVNDMIREGVQSIHISMPRNKNDEENIHALREISHAVHAIPMDSNEQKQDDDVDPLLTRANLINNLPYRLPWNVIVAPIQDWRQVFNVAIMDPV